jgi:hypothetical protein
MTIKATRQVLNPTYILKIFGDDGLRQKDKIANFTEFLNRQAPNDKLQIIFVHITAIPAKYNHTVVLRGNKVSLHYSSSPDRLFR